MHRPSPARDARVRTPVHILGAVADPASPQAAATGRDGHLRPYSTCGTKQPPVHETYQDRLNNPEGNQTRTATLQLANGPRVPSLAVPGSAPPVYRGHRTALCHQPRAGRGDARRGSGARGRLPAESFQLPLRKPSYRSSWCPGMLEAATRLLCGAQLIPGTTSTGSSQYRSLLICGGKKLKQQKSS